MSDNEIEDVSFLPGESLHRRAVYEPSIFRRIRILACTKSRAAVIVVVICMVVLVIALIAALSRGKSSSPCLPATSGSDQSNKPTDSPQQQDYISTNGKPFPYKDIRLPISVIPLHYQLSLQPDIEKSTFVGTVNIQCDIKENTDHIVFHSKNLTIKTIQVKNNETGTALKVVEHLIYDGNEQVYVKLGTSVKSGASIKLIVEFSGNLSQGQLNGFYKSMYKTSAGEKRYIATTHFEPTSARKAFPCFDEPALKATFQLTMIRQKKYISLFNMPLETTLDYKDSLMKDVFQQSVKMSTYLVAFVVCDYEKVEGLTKRNITVRVFTPPEFIHAADFALDTAIKVIDYYEEYFGVQYPLPKQDLIAIPDFEAGAMENWGLITYRMTAILYDPRKSSVANKQRVAVVIAHELAHQWFGNLVTLKWWNDLWLNEGFASYVEYIGTNIVNPEWKMMDQFITDAVQRAMYLDSLENSHPINQSVHNPNQINELFDAISYDKGASIIRMLNNYLGEEVFKKGLNSYLNKYKYSNAETLDLWKSLSEAVTDNSEKDVISLMNTWTEQSGYPVVTINRSGKKVTVTQSRFLLNTSPNATVDDKSPFGYKWQIPFCYTTSGDPQTLKKMLIKESSVTFQAENLPETGWIKGNCGLNGYYRVNYDDQTWEAITMELNREAQDSFSTVDRAGFIDDAFMLARTGQIKYAVAFNLTINMVHEKEFIPWDVFLSNIKFLWSRLQSKPIFSSFKAHLLKLMKNQLDSVSWEDTGSDLDKYLRATILNQAIELDHDASVSKGRELFQNWKNNNASLNVNLKATIYKAGILYGDDSDWLFIWEKYLTEPDDSEKRRLIWALGKTKEASLVLRLLGYSLNETVVRSQDTVSVIRAVTTSYTGQILAWRFVQKNWDIFYKRYGEASFTMSSLIKSVCSSFDTQFDYDEVKSFFATRHGGSGERAVHQVLEKIQANMYWVDQYQQHVMDWIEKRV